MKKRSTCSFNFNLVSDERAPPLPYTARSMVAIRLFVSKDMPGYKTLQAIPVRAVCELDPIA